MDARRAELARAGAALALAAALLLTAAYADGTRRPALGPERAAALWDQALVARNEGRPAESLACVNALLRAYPRDGRFLELKALAHGKLGQTRAEAAAWEQYFAWSAAPAEACPRLGQAYERLGEPERALDAHRRCRDLDPVQPDLRLHYGRALESAGRREEAEALYEGILKDATHYLDAALFLGRLKAGRGDLAGAAALIEPVVAARPDSADPLLFAALLDLERGAPASAVARLRRALRGAPDYADLYRVLARACDATKDAACSDAARGAVRDLDAGRPPRALPPEAP